MAEGAAPGVCMRVRPCFYHAKLCFLDIYVCGSAKVRYMDSWLCVSWEVSCWADNARAGNNWNTNLHLNLCFLLYFPSALSPSQHFMTSAAIFHLDLSWASVYTCTARRMQKLVCCRAICFDEGIFALQAKEKSDVWVWARSTCFLSQRRKPNYVWNFTVGKSTLLQMRQWESKELFHWNWVYKFMENSAAQNKLCTMKPKPHKQNSSKNSISSLFSIKVRL